MFVQTTMVGTVVTPPQHTRTSNRTPVTNFALSTKRKTRNSDGMWVDADVTTWIVHAYGDLAVRVLDTCQIGQSYLVTGSLYANEWTTPEGVARTRIDMRALSIAPNLGDESDPVRLVLRGTVAEVPEEVQDGGTPTIIETSVRTSRFKRGRADEEADVTYWPVTAMGPMAERMMDWRVGEEVVVIGEARPVDQVEPDSPQVEVWATTAGRDLVPQRTPAHRR